MAPKNPTRSTTKRKRNSNSWVPKKRRKTSAVPSSSEEVTDPSQEEELSQSSSGEFWSVRSIVNERRGQYLVDWEPDQTTGKEWPQEWIRKSDVTQPAIDEWNARKAAARADTEADAGVGAADTPKTGRKRTNRPRPITDSQSSPAATQEPEGAEPAEPETSSAPPAVQPAGIQVQISRPPDFDPDDYQHFSTVHSSQAEPRLTATQTSEPGSSSVQEDPGFLSTGIVLDSQSSRGSATYAPTTQESSGLIQNEGEDGTEGEALEQDQATATSSRAPTSSDVVIASTPLTNPFDRAHHQSLLIVPGTTSQEGQQSLEIPESPAQEDPHSDSGQGFTQTQASADKTEEGAKTLITQAVEQRQPETVNAAQHSQETSSALETSQEETTQDEVSQAQAFVNQTNGPLEVGPESEGISAVGAAHTHGPESPASTTQEEPFATQSGLLEEHGEASQQGTETAVPEIIKPSVPRATAENGEQLQTEFGTEAVHSRDFADTSQEHRRPPETNTELEEVAELPSSPTLFDAPLADEVLEQVLQNSSVVSEISKRRSASVSVYQDIQQEQHAQVVPEDLYLSTQDDPAETVRPTIEVDAQVQEETTTPNSRHDSSQESPAHTPSEGSTHQHSHLPRPPPFSIYHIDSIPPRPKTPENTSSLFSKMTDPTSGKSEIEDDFKSLFKQNVVVTPTRRMLHTVVSSSAADARSPSIIPDQPLQRQEPVSLKTSALIGSAAVEAPEPPLLNPPVPAAEIAIVAPDEDMEMVEEQSDIDDDDDDDVSLLNESIQLMPEEHIVPLPMDGRQRNMYIHELRRKEDILKQFLHSPNEVKEIDEIDTVLKRLKAVETHVDTIYSEGSSQAVDPQMQAVWDTENCVKFRFLGAFLHAVRKEPLNVFVVLEEDDERMFGILEQFCLGKFVNYNYPGKGRTPDLLKVEGRVRVTMLSMESSYIVQPPDAIICLDTAMDASRIRKKNWAANPDRPVVPVIQLVIPRSAGHIERYVSSSLSERKRLHTVFASLAQVHGDIGRPISVNTPRAPKAGELVASYLISLDAQDRSEKLEWPLPAIGSIKELIEYASQQAHETVMSSPPLSPLPGSSKRHLDVMDLDPVKRPRLTPQPTSSANPEAEITHVSDSMPGTAPAMPPSTTLPLPQQLLETQTSLAQAQAALKANDKRHREVIASWEKRQYEYEDLVQRHRLLMGKFESATKTTETNAKHRELTTQRYEKRGAELEDLRKQLAEQKAVNATSDDEKIALITRLRDELAESKLKEDRATKRAESSEQTLEYTKEQYRLAQDSATDLAQQVATLNSAMPALQIQASGELTALKSLHLSKSYGVLKRKLEVAKVERENAAKILEKKDEEIAKLKSEKKSYGTRGGSVPRSPRVGAGASAGPPSRGASPLPGGRDRVANLRNG